MRKWLVALVCSATLVVRAAGASDTEHRRSPYVGAIVVDAANGRAIFSERADCECYPASCTKLMTMYLALEAVREGKVALADRLYASAESLAEKPSVSGLKAGDGLTLENAFKALMVKSANDVAVMIAVHIAGSTAAFVERMNETAKKLGMDSTRFVSPNGYPPPRGSKRGFDVSTAGDLSILARALVGKHPEILDYTSLATARVPSLNGESFEYVNHNNLIAKPKKRMPEADGLKTGYHNAGGSSLVLTGKRDGKRAIVVVVGSAKAEERDEVARKLLTDSLGSLSW